MLPVAAVGQPVSAPHDTHILLAPPGVNRWEPSGAAVIPGDARLWVVNDKTPVLAAYALPLTPGPNTPVFHTVITQTLRTPPVDKVKLEAVRWHPLHGLLLLDAFRRGIVAGVQIDASGAPVFDFELQRFDAPKAALDAVAPEPFDYVAVEALGVIGDVPLTGTRGYVPKGGRDAMRARSVMLDARGRATAPSTLTVGGREFGLSDLVCPPGLPDRCYETWSYENEKGDTTADVAGLLAVAPIIDGLPGTPRICRTFGAKAEGIARFRDTLIVVFDDDLRRKRPGEPSHFPIETNQDFATTLPLADCPL